MAPNSISQARGGNQIASVRPKYAAPSRKPAARIRPCQQQPGQRQQREVVKVDMGRDQQASYRGSRK